MQLSVKYRPDNLKKFVGQKAAVEIVSKLLKKDWPSAVLITGSTGSGKTTLARIIVKELDSERCCEEINVGDSRGIDDIRELSTRAKLAPLGDAKCRIFILDEVHTLTAAAASALLKVLEEPTATTKFILCTDKPEKLLKTILGRCIKIQLQQALPQDLVPYLNYVAKKEGQALSKSKLLEIAELAGGQPRESLQLLQLALNSPKAKLEALVPQMYGSAADQLAKLTCAALDKNYMMILSSWSYLTDRKAACKSMIWALEYCLAKMSKAKTNPRWSWFSYEKETVYKAIKSYDIKDVIALYSNLAEVLMFERETTQLDAKLLATLLT